MKNRLAQETSPYLQQHADNPVDWHPWDQQALQLAKDKDKPILLSIGYSACHWCHVMAHESFADNATAELMNQYFINIKVDREERPDLDKIYQTAQYLLNQRSGGWPLTMFLTPNDQVPFFGGTYFPPQARHGLPSFKDLLHYIHTVYTQQRDQIATQNDSMQQTLSRIYQNSEQAGAINKDTLYTAEQQLLKAFDAEHGGFGKAPKFPHPTHIDRALRSSLNPHNPDREQLQKVALFSLTKMCEGGVFDQLGGGFYRYSTDDYWMIPHFEKMLYDNGPLITLYSYAYQLTQNHEYATTVQLSCDWVIREMQSDDGAFYSSLDADSEGEEGKFYIWNQSEIQSTLNSDQYAVFEKMFALNSEPNFEGRYHLSQHRTIQLVAVDLSMTEAKAQDHLQQARAKLFATRLQRVAPDCDQKVLTSWNSLMIKALTIAGRTLDRSNYIDAADRALQFIRQNMWQDGRLLASFKDGRAHLNAYLDDYAFLLDAVLEHLQTRWNPDNLIFAQQLADTILSSFEDTRSGVYYFTSHDHENLIQRPQQSTDEATPSGSAIATIALTRLGNLLGESRYSDSAERSILANGNAIDNNPIAHSSFLNAWEESTCTSELIILRGFETDELLSWQQLAQSSYCPHRQVYAIPISTKDTDLPTTLSSKSALPERAVTAYRCIGKTCQDPITDKQEFQQLLTG